MYHLLAGRELRVTYSQKDYSDHSPWRAERSDLPPHSHRPPKLVQRAEHMTRTGTLSIELTNRRLHEHQVSGPKLDRGSPQRSCLRSHRHLDAKLDRRISGLRRIDLSGTPDQLGQEAPLYSTAP